MSQQNEDSDWLPEGLCPSPTDLHRLIQLCERLSAAIEAYEKHLGGREAIAIQDKWARESLSELAESIDALDSYEDATTHLEAPELVSWPEADFLGCTLRYIWEELQHAKQFFSTVLPEGYHEWRYWLVELTPGLFPDFPVPKKSLLSWCYLPDAAELIARELVRRDLPNWGHPVWSMTSHRLTKNTECDAQRICELLWDTFGEINPFDVRQIERIATELGEADQAAIRIVVKNRQTQLPLALCDALEQRWGNVELDAESFRWPSILNWSGRTPEDGTLGVDFATAKDSIIEETQRVTSRCLRDSLGWRELRIPLAEFPKDSPSLFLNREASGPPWGEPRPTPKLDAPYPLEYYQSDPFLHALKIELETRTRLRDDGNPLWFRRIFDDFQRESFQCSFAEYCSQRFSEDVEALPSEPVSLKLFDSVDESNLIVREIDGKHCRIGVKFIQDDSHNALLYLDTKERVATYEIAAWFDSMIRRYPGAAGPKVVQEDYPELEKVRTDLLYKKLTGALAPLKRLIVRSSSGYKLVEDAWR